jgi:hypothetical protein
MKRFCFLLSVWVLASLGSCKTDVPMISDCPDAGAFAKRVENVNGRIYYDSTETKYLILVPNSMDSHDVGFVCVLDTKFQQEGLPVKFSGRYYAYSKTLQRFAGDRFYSLSIEAISLR